MATNKQIMKALRDNPRAKPGRLTILFAGAWVGLILPDASNGSDAGAPEAAPIAEIVVSARRREERLQDVGLTISVLDSDRISDLGLRDPRDLVLHIPNLQMQSSFAMSNPAVFLRGVGINDVSAIASSTVGFYLDEVYLGSPAGQLFQFFDLERIEVLRGPQGTLYGRNTPAGAVNFLSRAPSAQLEARLRARYGRFNERSLEGGIGGPISDGVSGRIAFITNRRDGYVDNLTLNSKDSDTDNWAARASLLFEPNESIEWLFKAYVGRSDSGSKRNQSQGLLSPGSVIGGSPVPCSTPQQLGTCSDPLGYVETPDPFSGNWNRHDQEHIDHVGASARLTWKLPGFTIDSITAFGEARRSIGHDADGSPNQLLEIDWQDDSQQWSQEFRFGSPDDRPLQWIAGLYHFDRDVDMGQLNDVFRELRPVVGFNPMLGVFSVRTDFDADITASAIFGEVGLQVTQPLRLVSGLRYTSEEHRIDRFDRIQEPGFAIPLVDLQDRTRFNDVSGKVGLEFKTERGNLLFAHVSRGFKSGGFNGSAALDPESVPPFDKETLISVEAGSKWVSDDRRVRANVTGFLYDYRDLQVFTRVNTGGIPREILTNAADASVLGLEGEVFADLGSGWNLHVGLGLLDTELEDFQTFGGNDFSGNELVYAPRFSASAFVRRTWSLGGAQISAQLDYHYQDDQYFETSNNPLLSEGGYGVWNTRVAYQPSGSRWEFAFWGRNLSDTRYKVAVIELADFGFNNITFNEPRTWGLELLWQL